MARPPLHVDVERVLTHARELAAARKSAPWVRSEQLVLAMVLSEASPGGQLLRKLGLQPRDTETLARLRLPAEAASRIDPHFSRTARSLLIEAGRIAEAEGHPSVTTEHLLLAISLSEDSRAAHLLRKVNVDTDRITGLLTERFASRGENALDAVMPGVIESAIRDLARRVARDGGTGILQISRAGENVATATADRPAEGGEEKTLLSRFARDLTAEARAGKLDPVIGREKEIQQMTIILSRRSKNNPLLIGEPGVGKTALAEGLAGRIAEDKAGPALRGKRVLVLDLAALVAGTKFRGEFEERLRGVIGEAEESGRGVILFIDEIHTIVGAGGSEGALDAANMLKPALARGKLQLIGATTFAEVRKIESDGALMRRFQPVRLAEPSQAETTQILRGIRTNFEKFHSVRIPDELLDQVVSRAARYLQDRHFPDKAIDLLDEATASVAVRESGDDAVSTLRTKLDAERRELLGKKQEAALREDFTAAMDWAKRADALASEILKLGRPTDGAKLPAVDEHDLDEAIARMTGVPLEEISRRNVLSLAELRRRLGARVIGQDDAVEKVSRAILRAKAGLRDPRRPLGAFLLVGPSGTGKTFLAETISDELFGEDALIRLDGGEFSESASVAKLIGAAPGYVGHEDGGRLTEAVRRRPHAVILLDEIEKAHRDVWNLLLGILEHGFLADSRGRQVSFRHTVIIATSNVGARKLREAEETIGFSRSSRVRQMTEPATSADTIRAELRRAFPPELVGRFDEIATFAPIGDAAGRRIAAAEIERIAARLRAERGIDLHATPAAVKLLVRDGVSAETGARDLHAIIVREVEDPVAERILMAKKAPTGFEIDAVRGKIAVREK